MKNSTIDTALRLAKQKNEPGYDRPGSESVNAHKNAVALLDEINTNLPHIADGFKKGGKVAAPVEPEPGSDAYWAEKDRIYAMPHEQRLTNPNDPTRYISPKEYRKGYIGRGEYVMADGGRAGMAVGGDPTQQDGNPIVAQSNNPAVAPDATQNYVQSLYKDVLGRQGDTSGVNYWADQLRQGNMDQPSMLQQFAASKEFGDIYKADPSKAVSTLYQEALGRAPDTSGAQYWTQQAQKGMDLPSIVAGFQQSPEGQTAQDISNYYQDYTGNVATPEQIQQAQQQIGPNQDWSSFLNKTFPQQTTDYSNLNPTDYQEVQEARNRNPKVVADVSPDITPDYQKIISSLGEKVLGSFQSLSKGTQDYLAGLIGQESGGTPDPLTAGAKKSNARGMFQFVPNTWVDQFHKVFGDTGLNKDQILALRTNRSPEAQAINLAIGQNYMNEGANQLKNAKVPITPGSLYSVHFLGNPGIAKLAMSNPNAPAARAMDAAARKANPEIARMTAGNAMKFFEDTINKKSSMGYEKVLNPYVNLVKDRVTATPTNIDPEIAQSKQQQQMDEAKANYQKQYDAIKKSNSDYILNYWNQTHQFPDTSTLPQIPQWDPKNYQQYLYPDYTPAELRNKYTPAEIRQYQATEAGQDYFNRLAQQGAGVNFSGTGMIGTGQINQPGIIPGIDTSVGTGTMYNPVPSDLQNILNKNTQQQFDLFKGTMTDPSQASYTGFNNWLEGLKAQAWMDSISPQPWSVQSFKRGGIVKPTEEDVEKALRLAKAKGGRRVNSKIDKDPTFDMTLKSGGGAWTRKEGQNPEGGLNAKGRASAKAEGHNLKPPAPHPKTDKDAARRKSFCSRMKGMKAKLTSSETANDPDSRINKSLRAWNCHSDGGVVDDALKIAKGGQIWDKKRPKNLGEPEALSTRQKKSAKAAAKAAGRPWPNLIDNMRAAQRKK